MDNLIQHEATPHRASTVPGWIISGLCWTALLAEGFDNGAIGVVIPLLNADPAWHLTAQNIAQLGSSSLFGMFFGGVIFGHIGDRFGRKMAFICCFIIFSVSMGLGSLAQTTWQLGLLRFVGGMAIAGIIPQASALNAEIPHHIGRHVAFGLMYAGYPAGIFLAAFMGAVFHDVLSWRGLLGLSFVPLLLLPLYFYWLPGDRGQTCSTRHGREESDPVSLKVIFAPAFLRATVGFYLTYILSMILVYGLATWLPMTMRSHGYSIGSSLTFLADFSLFSALGGIILGAMADRWNARSVISGSLLLGAVALVGMGLHGPMLQTYFFCALSGAGSIGSAVLLTSYTASFYPRTIRATVVGSCISISRIGATAGPFLGAVLSRYNIDVFWNFCIYGLFAFIAAFCILLVPHRASS